MRAHIERALAMIVRRTCIGSPQPPAPSRISGNGQTVRMSSAAWAISVNDRLASVPALR